MRKSRIIEEIDETIMIQTEKFDNRSRMQQLIVF